MPTICVGMSGGVDSSVSALLLKKMGYKVFGLYMKNWEETDSSGICTSQKDFEDVIKVCEQIDIPYYTVNFTNEYHTKVFTQFLYELQLGYTPNPDVLCNREIKFNVLLQKALDLGADLLATGHYARIDERKRLLKGLDFQKDQSYFLYTLKQEIFSKILFPIGHLEKKEVRKIAEENKLPTARKKDSTGICFIGERNFRSFLSRYLPYQPGHFKTRNGKVVGEHIGTAFYTIGQRKGLKIGGPGAAWFVVDKDVPSNTIFVEQGTDHPSLYASKLIATEAQWIGKEVPKRCSAKIRYRQADQACEIFPEDQHILVRFETPQRAITPRQSIVFYDGDICLGGAMIKKKIDLLRN